MWVGLTGWWQLRGPELSMVVFHQLGADAAGVSWLAQLVETAGSQNGGQTPTGQVSLVCCDPTATVSVWE